MSVTSAASGQTSEPFAARAALLLVAFLWGVNYIATNFGLRAFSPWTFRTLSFLAGAGLLAILAPMIGASLRVRKVSDRFHLIVSGLFACGGFGALSAIAILYTSTGRAAICAYTMPIWVALAARVILKETLTTARIAALVLCAAGLLVLLWPLIQAGVSLGALAAIGSAICWAIGIVYLKWARVPAHPLAVAIYQLLAGALVSIIGMLFTGVGVDAPVGVLPWLGLLYGVVAGTAVAYPLWFKVLDRLPAGTAGLGTLLVPVFGVIASAIVLGERPTPADLFGFALILIAAAIALRAPAQPMQT
ncbi:DMT family transporter [Parvibaculum sp.]|uniref:DMT family transporter n=1 Tax=Parvibaculum sp. TaxID=2024848 RepID=UPI0038B3EC35